MTKYCQKLQHSPTAREIGNLVPVHNRYQNVLLPKNPSPTAQPIYKPSRALCIWPFPFIM